MSEPFRSKLAEALREYFALYPASQLYLVAGVRSAALQDALAKEKPGLALPAARSLHPRGLAVDLGPKSEMAAFAEVAARHGLKRPRHDEPWHFQ